MRSQHLPRAVDLQTFIVISRNKPPIRAQRPVAGRTASLASSSEDSEVDGGPSFPPPPSKKLRLSAEMHAPQQANAAVNRSASSTIALTSRRSGADAILSGDPGQATNGNEGTLRMNGEHGTCEPSSNIKLMSRSDKDIIRLIGQHLQTIGLTYAAALSILTLS